MKKIGILLIVTVLFAILTCAGAAGAEVVDAGTIDSVQSAINDGKDVQLTDDIEITSNCTLDLKGKTVRAKENTRLFTVQSGVIFTLMDSVGGGKLVGNGVIPTTGGGIFVNGTFIMNSGIITDCSAKIIGGGVLVNNGTFEMNGGSILNCNCNISEFSAGGGIGVYSGMFIMNGGTITDCYTKGGGGGAYIYNESTFTMLKGSISNCTGVDGSGVEINTDSTFIMDGGEITSCNAKNCGGGVLIYSGRFIMNGGKIAKCGAETGGGVYACNETTFTMDGGTITDCTSEYGGGVYIPSSSCTFTVKGAATIKGNTNSTLPNNVFLDENASLELADTLTGTISIGYPEPKLGTPFGRYLKGDVASAHHLVSDIPGYYGVVNGSTLTWATTTSKSPAPFIGLIAGLGIAGLVLARQRR